MNRLNRWQRLGIVLSVLWALGAAFVERDKQIESGNRHAQLMYKFCLDNPTKNHEACSTEFRQNVVEGFEPSWGNVAFVALAPILLAWILLWAVIKTFRWVMAGSK